MSSRNQWRSWRQKISEEMEARGDSFDEMVSCTLTDDELDVEFDDSFGEPCGKRFTLWTQRFVYFPTVYDGAESVSSVPRDPCGEPTWHVGGW